MRRRALLLNVATLLLLVLATAAAVLWGRSYAGGDVFSKLSPGGFELVSHRGQLTVWNYEGFPSAQPLRWTRGGSSRRYLDVTGYDYAGEGGSGGGGRADGHTYYRPTTSGQGTPVRVTWTWRSVPHWVVFAVLSILPAVRLALVFRRVWRERGRVAGGCPTCGYDLRATPHRCPECGTVPAGAAGTA